MRGLLIGVDGTRTEVDDVEALVEGTSTARIRVEVPGFSGALILDPSISTNCNDSATAYVAEHFGFHMLMFGDVIITPIPGEDVT